MSKWKNILTKIANNADEKFDELNLQLQQRLGNDKPLQILPYLGYGTAEVVKLRGRVLRRENIIPTTDKSTLWNNLLNTYRHLESDEIPHAKIKATVAGVSEQFTANDEGYFEVNLQVNQPPAAGTMWHEVHLELMDAPIPFEGPVTAVGRALVPMAGATFGIISDIDDTVLQSSATNYLKAARLMFLKNARTRLPFAGVAAFYQMLQQGDGTQSGRNPVFYVSSSPWNLYPLLIDFFEFQNIPTGPLFLKDYGITADQLFTSGHGKHKLKQIEKIMSTYPELPFVLVGDSGQKDPEIYQQAAAHYPGRIKAIYIRDVSDDQRDEEVRAIAADVERTHGVPMILAADSLAAAEHAAAHGMVPPDKLPGIRQAMTMDAAAPSAIEALLEEPDEL